MNQNTETEVEFSLSLIGQWPEPMLLLDGDRFIEANPAAVRLLAYPDKSTLLGRSPGDISPPFQPDGEVSAGKARKFLDRVLHGETVRFEWVHLSAGGQEVQVDVTLSPILHGDRRVVLCAWHEIGGLKQAEKAARQANEALLKSNLELKHFAEMAAHDLQTPLRTISVFTQLLHQEALNQLSEQARQWSALVVDGSKRMQAMVEDLLTYARLDGPVLPLEPVDCGALLAAAKANLARRIQEAGAEVAGDGLPMVLAERTPLLQVLQNLIENGIKYNTSTPPRVTVSARREGTAWVFSVADNGIGIDPALRGQVFEMFRRLHTQQEYPGTGIGLAICQRVVERHGGKIWVESGEGGGSVFSFTLPAADSPWNADSYDI
jgi:PAS domain S-box-containing protein